MLLSPAVMEALWCIRTIPIVFFPFVLWMCSVFRFYTSCPTRLFWCMPFISLFCIFSVCTILAESFIFCRLAFISNVFVYHPIFITWYCIAVFLISPRILYHPRLFFGSLPVRWPLSLLSPADVNNFELLNTSKVLCLFLIIFAYVYLPIESY